jgi:transcriptional regulator with XRE-family HTH domain
LQVELIKAVKQKENMTNRQIAEKTGLSESTVSRILSRQVEPKFEDVVLIAVAVGVSLDALVLGNDNRVVEEMKNTSIIKPQYENINEWEFYSSNLITEYQQSVEEGLDIEKYKDVFESVSSLPLNEIKEKLGEVLFEVVQSANQQSRRGFCIRANAASRKGMEQRINVGRMDVA